mmetsp:Transcript_28870/g.43596  ORF Transcript_28870/g.43596 Transcript_28870/m.43596 type:complete len:243 (-) Transcript_28870:1713-2441(-)
MLFVVLDGEVYLIAEVHHHVDLQLLNQREVLRVQQIFLATKADPPQEEEVHRLQAARRLALFAYLHFIVEGGWDVEENFKEPKGEPWVGGDREAELLLVVFVKLELELLEQDLLHEGRLPTVASQLLNKVGLLVVAYFYLAVHRKVDLGHGLALAEEVLALHEANWFEAGQHLHQNISVLVVAVEVQAFEAGRGIGSEGEVLHHELALEVGTDRSHEEELLIHVEEALEQVVHVQARLHLPR